MNRGFYGRYVCRIHRVGRTGALERAEFPVSGENDKRLQNTDRTAISQFMVHPVYSYNYIR